MLARLLPRAPDEPALGRADRASGPTTRCSISMVFQGLDAQRGAGGLAALPRRGRGRAGRLQARRWSPFEIVSTSARDFWAPTLVKRLLGFIGQPTTGPARRRATSSGPATRAQAGQVLHGYQSAWLPAALLRRRAARSAGRCAVRGLAPLGRVAALQQGAGRRAGRGALAAARDTRDEPGRARRLRARDHRRRGAAGLSRRRRPRARRRRGAAAQAPAIAQAMDELRQLAPERRRLRVGEQLLRARLAAAPSGARTTRGCSRPSRHYDPDGLFFVHHGVGSEAWSADGFSELADRGDSSAS